MRRYLFQLLALFVLSSPVLAETAEPRIFYVRQTVGADTNDGLSPTTAWRSISKLGYALEAGDTAYVGPGLYRDQIIFSHSGTAERRINLIGDPAGESTGDPPGVVMIAGSDPFDESLFAPHDAPGVYAAILEDESILGLVEMDGRQYPYVNAADSSRHRLDSSQPLAVVAQLPSSFFFDAEARRLFVHTSDGRPPTEHEIEVIHRSGGVTVNAEDFVTVARFTIRHTSYAGISFGRGAVSAVAVDNVSYGHHQGIGVRASTDVLVSGNTLLRNDNSGVYFLSESVNGVALANRLYDNVKGIRWGSQSNAGVIAANAAFDNLEAGISVESAAGIRIVSNTLSGNCKAQLNVIDSEFHSEGNCFERRELDELIASLDYEHLYSTLAEYREAVHEDLSSHEGACRPLPEKLNVGRIHADTVAYGEKARAMLAAAQER